MPGRLQRLCPAGQLCTGPAQPAPPVGGLLTRPSAFHPSAPRPAAPAGAPCPPQPALPGPEPSHSLQGGAPAGPNASYTAPIARANPHVVHVVLGAPAPHQPCSWWALCPRAQDDQWCMFTKLVADCRPSCQHVSLRCPRFPACPSSCSWERSQNSVQIGPRLCGCTARRTATYRRYCPHVSVSVCSMPVACSALDAVVPACKWRRAVGWGPGGWCEGHASRSPAPRPPAWLGPRMHAAAGGHGRVATAALCRGPGGGRACPRKGGTARQR